MPAFSLLQLASGCDCCRRALLRLAELRADFVEARLLLVAQRVGERDQRRLHGLDRVVGRLQPLDHRLQPAGWRHRHGVGASLLELRRGLVGGLAQVFEQALLIFVRLHRLRDLIERPRRHALGLVRAEVARRLGDAPGRRRGAARRGAGGYAAVRPGIGSLGGVFGVRRAVGKEHAVEHVVVGVGPVARIVGVRPERVVEHVVVGIGVIDRAAPRNVGREQAKAPRRARRKPCRAPSGELSRSNRPHWRAAPTQNVPAWPVAPKPPGCEAPAAAGSAGWPPRPPAGSAAAADGRSAARRAGGCAAHAARSGSAGLSTAICCRGDVAGWC